MIIIDYALEKKIFRRESVSRILYRFLTDVAPREPVANSVHDERRRVANIVEPI
jgi:hypothetical protein